MSAASKTVGLEVGSTRPLSRAERRAQAARVKAEDAAPPAQPDEPTETTLPSAVQQEPVAELPAEAPTPQPPAAEPPAVRLKARQRKPKSPFATQLHPATLARLEWIKTRGYVITDTVDDAINTYLDSAGIPRPDDNDRMPPT